MIPDFGIFPLANSCEDYEVIIISIFTKKILKTIVMAAQALLKRGKRTMASCVKNECIRSAGQQPQLNELLTYLLDPQVLIDDFERIDWCRWLIAGGETFDEFAKTGNLTKNMEYGC